MNRWPVVFLLAGFVTVIPAKAASPFADKPCRSYAAVAGPDGKPAEIPWGDLKPDDFGPVPLQFDTTGLRAVRPVPPPGVHPRILFGPDDLPDIRARLKNTMCGQLMWKKILSWSHHLHGDYDDGADYAQPDYLKGDNRGSHGHVLCLYYHDKESPFNPANHLWDRLVSGDVTADPKPFWPVFSFDAYRCLIEDDKEGAHKLAAAVVTALKHDQAERDAERQAKGLTGPIDRPISGGAGGQELGYLYDFLYNYMTPDQRQLIHDELANTTWYHDNYGTFNAAVNSRSNWATFSYWLIPLLAIEGEPGFNDLKYAGMYRGWRNMFTYGWFPSGATVEGEAKDQLGMDGIIPFAMRQQPNLAAHPFLRAYAFNFLPHDLLPNYDYIAPGATFGNGAFVRYDLLGGIGSLNPNDAIGLKYLYPDNKTIDWIYRAEVGADYQKLPNGPGGGYFNGTLFAAIFPSDFDPANSDPSKLGLPLSYLAGDRGLVMTRSSWDTNALALNMHVRQACGGHPYCDRNSFLIAGQGRSWFTINTWKGETDQQSTVVIDQKKQTAWTPGRLVDYVDQPLATFAVGDASYCWDWDVHPIDSSHGYTLEEVDGGQVKLPKGGEPEMHSINDFAYTKRDFDYLNAPLWHLPHWLQKEPSLSPVVRIPNYPVKKAFRTCGLVRGKYPYALIVDDIQVDGTVHHYDWNGLLEGDVRMLQTAASPDGTIDITLIGIQRSKDKKAPELALPTYDQVPAGEPLLLVRVLDCKYDASDKDHAPVFHDASDKNKRILTLSADSVSPDYKVLIYPYRKGDPLPQTSWSADHGSVSVNFPGQNDSIRFSAAASGKTDVAVTRGGQVLADVHNPVPELGPGAPLPTNK
jgi:hypothetical protein